MAERHIIEGELRSSAQMLLLERLAEDGHDTTAAQELLETLQQMRTLMYKHRQQMLAERSHA
ncbi:MAG: hypothetical protein M3R24_19235 [Chloroflexota bacterium]|nr:hypothetical protein [Chloroflexota bacterium]